LGFTVPSAELKNNFRYMGAFVIKGSHIGLSL